MRKTLGAIGISLNATATTSNAIAKTLSATAKTPGAIAKTLNAIAKTPVAPGRTLRFQKKGLFLAKKRERPLESPLGDIRTVCLTT